MNTRATSLLLAILIAAPGCLTIEKKSLVMVVPPASKEVHLYYVFEGISVLDDKATKLERAKQDLARLKKPNFAFFSPATTADDSLLRHFRFEDARFFTNPERKRPLCMDRRVTITDRDALAKDLNRAISQQLWHSFKETDAKTLLAEIAKANDPAEVEKARRSFNDVGMGPLVKVLLALVMLAKDYDLDSVEEFRKLAANEETPWISFHANAIHVRFPATEKCARRIAQGPAARAWVKEMNSFVEPIDLNADAKGLLIVLGSKDRPVRFQHVDGRPYRPADEQALFEHAGSPRDLKIDGKAATADLLIERFLKEKRSK